MPETARPIVFCPSCQAQYRIAEHLLGRQVTCRKCGTLFRLGEAPEAASSSTAAPEVHPDPGPLGAHDIAQDDSYLVLGRLALKYHFIDLHQLRDALSYQDQERRRGRPLRLGEILVTHGLLSRAQLDFLLSVQDMLELRKLDQHFGVIAVKNGFATQAQIEAALAEQKQLFKTTKVLTPIGDLLLASGVLTERKKNAILHKQKRNEVGAEGLPAAPPLPAADETAAGEADAGFELEVAPDRLHAFLRATGSGRFNETAVRSFLEARGITTGVVADAQLTAWIEDPEQRGRPLPVAVGRPPIPGQNGWIKILFAAGGVDSEADPAGGDGGGDSDTDTDTDGDSDTDTEIRKETGGVQAGDVLAEKVPAQPGGPGVDVYGRPIDPAPVRDAALLAGPGTELSDHGCRLIATVPGVPERIGMGRVAVVPVLTIPGDVDAATGHITFDGAVRVAGTIQSGRRVTATSLSAGEMYRATIETSGSVWVRGGVIGCRIKAGGEIRAKYLRETQLQGLADLVVEKEIIDSRVEISGACRIRGGAILSSRISAKKGIVAGDIGSEVARPSTLAVGVDPRVEREISALKEAITEQRAAIEELDDRLDQLRGAAEQVQREIGATAQIQDRALVTRRRLDQERQQAEGHADARALAAAADALQMMDREIEQREHLLDTLFNRQDTTANQEAEVRQAMRQAGEASAQLENQILEWTEWANAEPGVPEVRVSGRLYADTEIEGLYASFKVRDPLDRVRIRERRVAGAGGTMEWKLVVGHLSTTP